MKGGKNEVVVSPESMYSFSLTSYHLYTNFWTAWFLLFCDLSKITGRITNSTDPDQTASFTGIKLQGD